jgi:hypothetical protein
MQENSLCIIEKAFEALVESSKNSTEIAKNLVSLSENQITSHKIAYKNIRNILIAFVIAISLICGVMFYFVYQSYNYEDYPTTTTNVSNTNENINTNTK